MELSHCSLISNLFEYLDIDYAKQQKCKQKAIILHDIVKLIKYSSENDGKETERKKMPLIQLHPKLTQICEELQKSSAQVYVAGGMVRDALLGFSSKDIDLEVHGIDQQKLLNILKRFVHIKEVGKSFEVCKFNIEEKEIDISVSDASTVKEACRRRDLRINSILYDPLTDQIVDPFDGINDIKNKMLTATDPVFFQEDPLRVLRVAQFSGRFNFQICTTLRELCLSLDLSHLPPDRVLTEINKSWLKSPKPSIAFREFHTLQIIPKYIKSWSGLEKPEVLESLDRGKHYCTENNGWNMALFWGLALQKCTPTEAEEILEQFTVHDFLKYKIRAAVFASLQSSEKLALEESSILRNHAAENFHLNFLCAVSMSIWPNGFGKTNLEKAVLQGMECSALPRIIQGRDILPFGLKGQEIGNCLSHIRQLELNEQLQNKSQGLEAIQQWITSKKATQ